MNNRDELLKLIQVNMNVASANRSEFKADEDKLKVSAKYFNNRRTAEQAVAGDVASLALRNAPEPHRWAVRRYGR